ncbi:MAG: UDP-2,3-diacylglucosamine diphosphatase [Bacteroidetes bacterium]|nr:MAG: UDP-2,3-diacylglucosamine diphosphatase [Bacteroidota bacterium]
MSTKVYFVSDFHFGIPDHTRSLERESRFIRWLDEIRNDASEIYLMGDLFDFWFEYRMTVPKGHIRLLGKLAEITDAGVPVHLFRGNHDMWAFNYLSEELHIQLHRTPEFRQFGSKRFYLAHGDGLGPGDTGYKFLKKVFSNRFNQWFFRWLHPDVGIPMALFWSRQSRYAADKREEKDESITKRIIETRLVTHSKQILTTHPDLDFLIYGHYHYPLDITLNDHARQIVLGDWLTHFSFAVFDGEAVTLKIYA